MSRWVDVASVYHLTPGAHSAMDAYGLSIAVFNVGGEYYAIRDACPYDGIGLAPGEVRGDELVCPRHGERYSLKTGAGIGPSAKERLAVLPVRVAQGRVQVEIEVTALHER